MELTNRERLTVTASSLGSYFGVGFNHPLEQLKIDLGLIEDELSEDEINRMELGNLLEDASLNVLEFRLGILITNRNTEVLNGLNGMLRMKLDGETVLDGENTIVENKVSNSNSGVFTNNLGYELQCQAYMAEKGYNQALLGGLYKGKPIWKIIKRNDDMIADIKEVVEAVYGILNGILGEEDYPWHIVAKYKKSVPTALDTFDMIEDGDLIEQYATASANEKFWDNAKSEIADKLKEKYNALSYQDDSYKLTISKGTRTGGFDEVTFNMTYPNIDLTKFRKDDIETKTIRITKVKK